ncbi:MAG TPA: sulfite exporter TauE/SafE family protein [Chloroflexota bacterium]
MTFPIDLVNNLAVQPQVVVLGAVVGVLVGLTGMGGASLMTPLLILVVGVRPTMAVGTDLLYSLFSKLAGAAVHARQRTVHWPTALWLAAGTIPGSLLGLFTLTQLERRMDVQALDRLVLHLLGITLTIVALAMFARLLLSARLPVKFTSARAQHVALPLFGAIVGYLVGLTSVGSGTLIVVVLTAFTPLPAVTIVGTDIVQAVMLLAASGTGHLLAGNVDLAMTANLLIGSVPGVILGSRLCTRMPEKPLRLAIATVLLVSGSRLI